MTRVDGEYRDFYTNTPIIHSASMLEELLQKARGKRVFVIGSGENMHDRRKLMRGDISSVLLSEKFTVVYTGRDNVTNVFLARPSGPDAQAARRDVASVAVR